MGRKRRRIRKADIVKAVEFESFEPEEPYESDDLQDTDIEIIVDEEDEYGGDYYIDEEEPDERDDDYFLLHQFDDALPYKSEEERARLRKEFLGNYKLGSGSCAPDPCMPNPYKNMLAEYLLAHYYAEVTPMEFYRNIFGDGNLAESSSDADKMKRPGRVQTLIKAKDPQYQQYEKIGYERAFFNELTELEKEINSSIDTYKQLYQEGVYGSEAVYITTLTNACSYFKRKTTADSVYQMFALVLEIDDIIGADQIMDPFAPCEGMTNLLEAFRDNIFPKPTYLVCSGKGLHLYYVFDRPIRLNWEYIPYQYANLDDYKKALMRYMWSPTISKSEPQIQGITQKYRVVGTPTKYGSICRAFEYCGGKTVSLYYMNSFCEKLQCSPITLLYGRDGDVDKRHYHSYDPVANAEYRERNFQTLQERKNTQTLMEAIDRSLLKVFSDCTPEISQCSPVSIPPASDDDIFPEDDICDGEEVELDSDGNIIPHRSAPSSFYGTLPKSAFLTALKAVALQVKVGHRYFAVYCLAVTARMCGIRYSFLERIMFEYGVLDILNMVEGAKENQFTKTEAEKAMKGYFTNKHFMQKATFERLTGVKLPDTTVKRNGRTRKEHLKYMQEARKEKRAKGEIVDGGGRPSKWWPTFAYRLIYPEGKKKDCMDYCKLSKATVKKYWGLYDDVKNQLPSLLERLTESIKSHTWEEIMAGDIDLKNAPSKPASIKDYTEACLEKYGLLKKVKK